MNIDLLLAVLPLNSVGAGFDINDDAVLAGAEDQSRRSLNGPRDTLLLIKLVESQTPVVLPFTEPQVPNHLHAPPRKAPPTCNSHSDSRHLGLISSSGTSVVLADTSTSQPFPSAAWSPIFFTAKPASASAKPDPPGRR